MSQQKSIPSSSDAKRRGKNVGRRRRGQRHEEGNPDRVGGRGWKQNPKSKIKRKDRPLCKYFLQRKCKFGDSCWFRHSFNENETHLEDKYYASCDETHDGMWVYGGNNGMMIGYDDEVDFYELQEMLWEDDLEELIESGVSPLPKREDEFVFLEKEKYGDLVDSLNQKGLHVATGVWRRILYDGGDDDDESRDIRITRYDDIDMLELVTLKKEGNELFLTKKYHEALEKYEDALIAVSHKEPFIAPIEQVTEIINVISNQAECCLRLHDYSQAGYEATNALVLDGKHTKSRIRRAKAELALYNHEKKGSLICLVQACFDLEEVINDSSINSLAMETAQNLLKKANDNLENERQKLAERNPEKDFDSIIRVLRSTFWWGSTMS